MNRLTRQELIDCLDQLLSPQEFEDYGPNGLQVEGQAEIKNISFAVSATRQSIEQAVENGSDTLIVHHGLFWKFNQGKTLTGTFAKRVFPLVEHKINLIAYHLPLDANLEIGNAAVIAKRLELKGVSPFGDHKGHSIGVKGYFDPPLIPSCLEEKLRAVLQHPIIHAQASTPTISSLGIITGGASSKWCSAIGEEVDSYLTGEISEHDWHDSQEANIHMFAGGHNATESLGIQALMRWTQESFDQHELRCHYISSSNPA
jgi:dinuclear metal center YbgI/SA1388 family protein